MLLVQRSFVLFLDSFVKTFHKFHVQKHGMKLSKKLLRNTFLVFFGIMNCIKKTLSGTNLNIRPQLLVAHAPPPSDKWKGDGWTQGRTDKAILGVGLLLRYLLYFAAIENT